MLDEQTLRDMLDDVAAGRREVDDVVEHLRTLPFETLGDAVVDHHRTLRRGFGEVVWCEHKTPEQAAQIIARMARGSTPVLGTRASREHYDAARSLVPGLRYHTAARAIYLDRPGPREKLPGVVVVAAGTSDLPVLEEAALTLELMGHAPQRIVDVGVAGIHRLTPHLGALSAANAIVVVAGMEGALPSVIGGLVAAPVVAVPTSVGYGANFAGVSALLCMLTACVPGISVVNIDNGFGGGYIAGMINKRIHDAAAAAAGEPVEQAAPGGNGKQQP